MDQPTSTRIIRVSNSQGVHARAATLIAEVVRRHQSKVTLSKGGERVEGTDVLQIMSLGVGKGDEVRLEAAGCDAQAVLDALETLFESHFGNEDDVAE